ncbi:MAG TPA: glycosyltransferase, partial [Chitinophagales bacterium]|nr:glycosyltransferase [Chitinophagales bacterium]
NLDYYKIPATSPDNKAEKPVVIGWSGSHTTIEHFETLIPVLSRLKDEFGKDIEIVVFGDESYTHKGLGIKGVAWSPETEVAVIASFDIGIMPLPDNEWSKGKCAMKGLQYMGLAVPAVLAAVGMNNDVIEEGVNGFLATTDEEWFNKLTALIKDAALRKRIGQAGRRTIEEKFSCQAKRADYVNIFLELCH